MVINQRFINDLNEMCIEKIPGKDAYKSEKSSKKKFLSLIDNE